MPTATPEIETPLHSGAEVTDPTTVADTPDVPQESQQKLNGPPSAVALPQLDMSKSVLIQTPKLDMSKSSPVPGTRPNLALNPPPAAGAPPSVAQTVSQMNEDQAAGSAAGLGVTATPKAVNQGFETLATQAPIIGSKVALTAARVTAPTSLNDLVTKGAMPTEEQFKKDQPIAAGLAESMGGTVGSIIGHPEFWPAMALSSGPRLLKFLGEVGFAGYMGKATTDGATALGAKWDTLSDEEKTKGVADLAQSAIFAATAGGEAGKTGVHVTGDVVEKFKDALTPKSQVVEKPIGDSVVPTRPTGTLAQAAEKRAPEVAKQFLTEQTAPAVAEGVSKTIQQGAGVEGQHPMTTEDPYGLASMSEGEKAKYQGPVRRMDAIDNNSFSNAQEARERAKNNFTTEGKAAWKESNQALSDLWDTHQSQLESEGFDVEGAKSAWGRKSALDQIEKSLRTTTELSADPERPYDLKTGKALGNTLTRLFQNDKEPFQKLFGDKYEEVKPVLQDFARTLNEQSTIAGSSPFDKMMSSLSGRVIRDAIGGTVGGIAGGPVGVAVGAGGVELGARVSNLLTNKLSQWYLGKILQTPEAMKLMTSSIKLGANPVMVDQQLNTILNNSDPTWADKTSAYLAAEWKNLTKSDVGTAGKPGTVDPNEGGPLKPKTPATPETPAVTNNASGESDASQEAINRAVSQKAQGNRTLRVNSFSNTRTPVLPADAVDVHPNPGEHIVDVDKNGNETIRESGRGARPIQPAPKLPQTLSEATKATIKAGGGVPRGVQEGIPGKIKPQALFDHPDTKSTLAVDLDENGNVDQKAVEARLASHKVDWDAAAERMAAKAKSAALDDAEFEKKVAKLRAEKAGTTPEASKNQTDSQTDVEAADDAEFERKVVKARAATTVRPTGSTTGLLNNPLTDIIRTRAGKGGARIPVDGPPLTTDLGMGFNDYTKKSGLKSLEFGEAPNEEMMKRAIDLAVDEGRYGLAQNNGASTWYTEQMAEHDRIIGESRPELKDPTNLVLFKANEAIQSSGNDPYNNINTAMKSHDLYMKNDGVFSPTNPDTPSGSWGHRGPEAFGNAFESLNNLIEAKGKQGTADWLLQRHTVAELREWKIGVGNKHIPGKPTDLQYGAMILGDKRGPFFLNLNGLEGEFTSDQWVNRTWNRWMGTTELGFDAKGKENLASDRPPNPAERALQKASFAEAAQRLGLTTSSLQAVLWYYEQALYTAHGVPKESWSFSDAAARFAKEDAARQATAADTATEAQGQTPHGWRKPSEQPFADTDTGFNTKGTGMASPTDEMPTDKDATHDFDPKTGKIVRKPGGE